MKFKTLASPKALFLFSASLALFAFTSAYAQTWLNSPGTNDWNTGANWDTSSVPNSSSAVATLGATTSPSIALSADVTLDGILFDTGAPSYLVGTGTKFMFLQGAGITNNSGAAQTLLINGSLKFFNSATAANASVTNNGILFFQDNSTSATASIDNLGSLTFINTSGAGGASITNNGSMGFSDTSTAGGAVINSTSFLSFNDNSSAGSAVISNSGFLGVYDGATLSSAVFVNDNNFYLYNNSTAGTASVTNNSNLSFNDASTAGASTITNNNGGVISLNNASTGGTVRLILAGGSTADISSHTGAVTVGSLEGAGTFSIGANGLAAGSNGLSTTFSGVIDDGIAAGSFTKVGGGIMTISGNNTYDGGTTVAGGSLLVDTGGQLGSGTVVNNATLDYINSGDAGGLTIINNLTMDFRDNSTANGSRITNISNLSFWDNSTAGNAVLTSTGALSFNNNSTAGNSTLIANSGGSISFNDTSLAGTARFYINSGGSFDISGHTGGVTVESIEGAGNLNFGSNNLAEGTNNLSTTLSGVLSGTGGSLTKLGTGTLTLSGTNTYSGGTSVNGGTLQISNDNNLGDATGGLSFNGTTLRTLGAVTSNRAVTINSGGGVLWDSGGFNSTLNGVVSGTGVMTKTGTGILTLNGSNTYTGGTAVNNGALVIGNSNGLGAGSVSLGAGTLGTGAGPLTINVGGDYTQSGAGILSLGVSTVGTMDMLNVTGVANLNGTLGIFSYNSFQPQVGDAVTLVAANNGISGQFSQWINPAGVRWFPVYQTYDVLAVCLQPSFSALGLTPNQTAVGSWMDNNFKIKAFENLVLAAGVQSSSALPAIYDLIAPDELTQLYQLGFALAQGHSALVERRLAKIRIGEGPRESRAAAWGGETRFAADLPNAQLREMAEGAPNEEPWGVFLNGSQNIGNITGDGNGAGYPLSATGMTAGVDYQFGKLFAGGVLVGYGQAGKTGGALEITGGQLGLFGDLHPGNFHLEALGEAGMNTYKIHRPGYGGTAAGTTQGQQFSGWVEMGFEWTMGHMKFGPFASGQYTLVQFDGFSEQGSLAPLTYGSQNQASLRSEVGARVVWNMNLGFMYLLPHLSAGWEHPFQGTLDTLTGGFPSGETFVVQGSATGGETVAVGGGLTFQMGRGLSVVLSYKGKFGRANYDSQSFSGGVNVGF